MSNLVRASASVLLLTIVHDAVAQQSPASSQNRFLLLDERVIASTSNAHLVVGTVHKHDSNPLFGEDRPWEKRFDNLYGNVIYDAEDNLYKCWYSPFIVDHSAQGMSLEERQQRYKPPSDREMGICYATSSDGIHWTKPHLGLVEYGGNKENNIVWRGPHGAGVFQDSHESDPQHRFKTLFQGLNVSRSPDGIHWAPALKLKGIRVAGDTHNNAFWSPTLGKYVGITRTWGKMDDKRVRQVGRMESDEFRDWTPVEVVLQGTTSDRQTYAMPVFYHGGVYLGLLAIHAQRPIDRVWTELAWSPDTKHWHRISEGTPLIPCSEQQLDYDYGCVYACAGPVFLKDEIRLYYGGSDWTHYGWRNGCLALATLRPDGFAGYEPTIKDQPASVTTCAVPCTGQPLAISADVMEGGSVKVSLIDENGKKIATAEPISLTVTDKQLDWDMEIQVTDIRLKIEFNNAKIYSFSYVGK